MPLIRPFAALRPVPVHAGEVLAPPYDVVNREEAAAIAADRPLSFLHVSRPEIDLPPDVSPHDDRVYARAAENFARLQSQGVLRRDPAAGYYVYRLVQGSHEQTGLVVAASVRAYEAGRIRRHELTRPDKEDDRTRHIEALNAQTGPAFLTYRQRPAIDALIDPLTAAAPQIDVTADDGVRHMLWPVQEPGRVAALGAAFEDVERLYIADGHHRSAAAARVAAQRRVRGSSDPDPAWEYFLAVVFPDTQLRILDYNRVVRDLNGMDAAQFLGALAARMDVVEANAPVRPAAPGEFGMCLAGRWHRLRVRGELPADPVARLDVSLLADQVLGPLLGIGNPRTDPRIDFVGGSRGLDALERRVTGKDAWAVAFALYPTRIEDLLEVADGGGIMPPKSTWFEPKLADGLVSHLLD